MRNNLSKKSKLIVLLIAIALIIIGTYLTFFLNIGVIFFIIPLEIVVLPWLFSKGNWEKKISKENSRKWRKSIVFSLFLVLFIAHSILVSYSWINIQPSLSDDPSSTLDLKTDIIFISFLLFEFIFILFLLWKEAPKQLLSIPLMSIIFGFIIPEIFVLFGLWIIGVEYYIFAALPILQIVWALYVRFVFLKEK